MKRTFLFLLTIAVAVALGFSQGKVTRQKTTKTEQSQQTNDKPKPMKEKKQKREADPKKQRETEAKKRQQAEAKRKREEEKRKHEEEKRQQEEEAQRKQDEEVKLLQAEEEQRKKEEAARLKDRGFINGHEWVDLGLPSGIKWATCNVGAETPEGCGAYFAWGDTTPKSEYNPVTMPSNDKIKEAREQFIIKRIDAFRNLTSIYDAASANWGDSWRMPTDLEFKELSDECQMTWITLNNIKGYKITGPNGNSIFLPGSGGLVDPSDVKWEVGEDGAYWSSSTIRSGSGYPVAFVFDNSYSGRSTFNLYYGFSVRPVSD